MKKNYKAPTFDVITYSLQEAIAANCTFKKYFNAGNGDADCEDPLFRDILFSDQETQCKDGPTITGYCYFTTNTNVVSTS